MVGMTNLIQSFMTFSEKTAEQKSHWMKSCLLLKIVKIPMILYLSLVAVIHNHWGLCCEFGIVLALIVVSWATVQTSIQFNNIPASSIGAVDDALEVFEAPFPVKAGNCLELFRRYVVVKDAFVFPEEFFFLFSHNQTYISEYRLFFLVEHLVGRAKGIRKPHRHLHGDWAHSAFKVL